MKNGPKLTSEYTFVLRIDNLRLLNKLRNFHLIKDIELTEWQAMCRNENMQYAILLA